MRRLAYIALVGVLAMIACKRTPSYVIGTGDMADLLADMHIAESVVDNNLSQYQNDSAKKVLKQSVLMKHGVTQEEFDTSLVWYGHHLDMYISVYDDVIKKLEKRNKELGTAIVQTAVTMSGDSVDVWPGLRYATLNSRMPSKFVAFDIKKDENWEAGDVYTWRLKLVDNENQVVHFTIVADYDDDSTDWLTTTSNNTDWNEVVYASDSTKVPVAIRGYFTLTESNNQFGEKMKKSADRTMHVDSISLIRKRFNADTYRYRYRLRSYPEFR